MEKIELIAMMSESKKVIDFLQRKGIVELTSHEVPDGMLNPDTDYNISQLEKFKQTAMKAKETLSHYAPEKKSLVDSFKPPKEMELSKFLEMSEEADKTMNKCYEILKMQKSVDDAVAEQIRCRTSNEALEVWKDLDIPTRFTPTKYVTVLIGTFPDSQTDATLKAALAERIPQIEAVETEVVYTSEMQSCAAVMCLKRDADTVNEALRSMGFVKPTELSDKTPKEIIKENRVRINDLDKQIFKTQAEIADMASEHENINFLIDYFTMRADKYEQFKKVSLSDNVLYLSGYIPEKYAKKTVEQLESRFTVAITLSEPEEDEDTPVLLENNAFASGVEGITEMYSLPGKNDIDPNAIMSFFYYLFFGMMFSDAGYGLLMVIATAFILLKCKPEGNKRKTVLMYFFCGISTMFWGVMFGSFFGDLINIIRTNYLGLPEMRLYLWLNPQGDDLMLTMLWCFLFGIVHLFVGLAIKGYLEWRQGDKLGAICDVLSVYLAVGGAAPICAGMIIDVPDTVKTVGKYCALVGVVLIVLTAGRSSKGIFGKLGSGLYALYNTISGYLSDVLSYSRLLALGLVTGIIGSVVNLMGTLPENTIVKTILFIVVFVVGHAINFGINVIGAYVHTNRLQYVEFFSRFYEGGGRAFNPLKVNSATFKLKEENYNG